VAQATETVFSVTDLCYETENFMALLHNVQFCAAECAEKLADLDGTVPERNHYPSRILKPVLSRSLITSRAKALQRVAFEARLDGLGRVSCNAS